MNPQIFYHLNALALVAVTGVLAAAIYLQITTPEIPCPLCLLQRVGFAAVGVGLVLNLTQGLRASHYGAMILAAFFGGSVSLRQISLHIVPGTGSYGDPLWGMHLYTWCFVGFVAVIVLSALMLMFERQFEKQDETVRMTWLAKIACGFFALIVLTNVIFTLIECSFGFCPEPSELSQEGIFGSIPFLR